MTPNGLTTTCWQVLITALQSHAVQSHAVSARACEFRLAPHQRVQLAATGPWLQLATSLPGGVVDHLLADGAGERLLAQNAQLPCGLCFALEADCRSALLMADLPLHDCLADGQQVVAQVQPLWTSLQQQLQQSSECGPADVPGQWPLPLTVDEDAGSAAQQLCQSTGWDYYERGSGTLAITLEVSRRFCQAFAYQQASGEFRLSTVLETPPLSNTSRQAVALFLLAATRAVRMARATMSRDHQARTPEYRWEVTWTALPSRTAFHYGLSALSLACRLTARELPALADEAIAQAYLRLRARDSQ